MKKQLLLTSMVLVLLAGGLWFSTRRQPSGTPIDQEASPFRVENAGPGKFIKFQDTQTPLRALRWVGPLDSGLLAAQLLTQSDRQRVAFFQEGQPVSNLLVSKPAGISDGFWRFAVLKEVAPLPGGGAALLYVPENGVQASAASVKDAGGSAALPPAAVSAVVVALDWKTADVKWIHRGAFQRMVLAPGTDPALYFFGSTGPIQRLSLAGAGSGEAGRNAPNGAAKSLELPGEVGMLEELLPTGGASFLVSHRNGLSAYRGSKGWTHFPLPDDRGVTCKEGCSSLIQAGRKFWWQPFPGKLVQIHPDGTEIGPWAPEGLPQEDPWAPDLQLLKLLGPDTSGALWFSLAIPLPSPVPAPAPVGEAPSKAAPEATPATGPGMDWSTYAAKGLDRIYRWDDTRHRLERFSWTQAWHALKPPAEVPPPGDGARLRPAAGALALEGVQSAWWLPLTALPFSAVQAK